MIGPGHKAKKAARQREAESTRQVPTQGDASFDLALKYALEGSRAPWVLAALRASRRLSEADLQRLLAPSTNQTSSQPTTDEKKPGEKAAVVAQKEKPTGEADPIVTEDVLKTGGPGTEPTKKDAAQPLGDGATVVDEKKKDDGTDVVEHPVTKEHAVDGATLGQGAQQVGVVSAQSEAKILPWTGGTASTKEVAGLQLGAQTFDLGLQIALNAACTQIDLASARALSVTEHAVADATAKLTAHYRRSKHKVEAAFDHATTKVHADAAKSRSTVDASYQAAVQALEAQRAAAHTLVVGNFGRAEASYRAAGGRALTLADQLLAQYTVTAQKLKAGDPGEVSLLAGNMPERRYDARIEAATKVHDNTVEMLRKAIEEQVGKLHDPKDPRRKTAIDQIDEGLDGLKKNQLDVVHTNLLQRIGVEEKRLVSKLKAAKTAQLALLTKNFTEGKAQIEKNGAETSAGLSQSAATNKQALRSQVLSSRFQLQSRLAGSIGELDRAMQRINLSLRHSDGLSPTPQRTALEKMRERMTLGIGTASAGLGEQGGVTAAQLTSGGAVIAAQLTEAASNAAAGLKPFVAQLDGVLDGCATQATKQAHALEHMGEQMFAAIGKKSTETFSGFEKALPSSIAKLVEAHFQSLVEQAKGYGDALVAYVKDGSKDEKTGEVQPGLYKAMSDEAEKAAAEVQPRWKSIAKWIVTIVVLVLVIVVAFWLAPFIIAGLATMMTGFLATVIGGAIVGAITGAVAGGIIQASNNLIDMQGRPGLMGPDGKPMSWDTGLWGWKGAVFTGLWTGALGGAVGGGLGAWLAKMPVVAFIGDLFVNLGTDAFSQMVLNNGVDWHAFTQNGVMGFVISAAMSVVAARSRTRVHLEHTEGVVPKGNLAQRTLDRIGMFQEKMHAAGTKQGEAFATRIGKVADAEYVYSTYDQRAEARKTPAETEAPEEQKLGGEETKQEQQAKLGEETLGDEAVGVEGKRSAKPKGTTFKDHIEEAGGEVVSSSKSHPSPEVAARVQEIEAEFNCELEHRTGYEWTMEELATVQQSLRRLDGFLTKEAATFRKVIREGYSEGFEKGSLGVYKAETQEIVLYEDLFRMGPEGRNRYAGGKSEINGIESLSVFEEVLVHEIGHSVQVHQPEADIAFKKAAGWEKYNSQQELLDAMAKEYEAEFGVDPDVKPQPSKGAFQKLMESFKKPETTPLTARQKMLRQKLEYLESTRLENYDRRVEVSINGKRFIIDPYENVVDRHGRVRQGRRFESHLDGAIAEEYGGKFEGYSASDGSEMFAESFLEATSLPEEYHRRHVTEPSEQLARDREHVQENAKRIEELEISIEGLKQSGSDPEMLEHLENELFNEKLTTEQLHKNLKLAEVAQRSRLEQRAVLRKVLGYSAEQVAEVGAELRASSPAEADAFLAKAETAMSFVQIETLRKQAYARLGVDEPAPLTRKAGYAVGDVKNWQTPFKNEAKSSVTEDNVLDPVQAIDRATALRLRTDELAAQLRRDPQQLTSHEDALAEINLLLADFEELRLQRALDPTTERRTLAAVGRLFKIIIDIDPARIPSSLRTWQERAMSAVSYEVLAKNHETAVEVETMVRNEHIQALTTADGTVGPVLKEGLGKTTPALVELAEQLGVPVGEVPWDALSVKQKTDLIDAQGLGDNGERLSQRFWERRDLPGLKFRDEVSGGILTRAQYQAPRDVGRLGGLEYHGQGKGRASELADQVYGKESGAFDGDLTSSHQHLPFKVPADILAGDPVARMALVDFYRRMDTLVELVLFAGGGRHSVANVRDGMIFFDHGSAQTLKDFNQHLYDLANNPNGSSMSADHLKMNAIGVRTGETYDGLANPKEWMGFEIRVQETLDKVSRLFRQRFTDAAQKGLLTKSYGLTREQLAAWYEQQVTSELGAGGNPELALVAQSGLLDRLQFNHANVLEHVSPALAETPEFKAAKANLADLDLSDYGRRPGEFEHEDYNFRMLVHDWSLDPVFVGKPEALARVFEAQRRALAKIAENPMPTRAKPFHVENTTGDLADVWRAEAVESDRLKAILRDFTNESGLIGEFIESVGMNDAALDRPGDTQTGTTKAKLTDGIVVGEKQAETKPGATTGDEGRNEKLGSERHESGSEEQQQLGENQSGENTSGENQSGENTSGENKSGENKSGKGNNLGVLWEKLKAQADALLRKKATGPSLEVLRRRELLGEEGAAFYELRGTFDKRVLDELMRQPHVPPFEKVHYAWIIELARKSLPIEVLAAMPRDALLVLAKMPKLRPGTAPDAEGPRGAAWSRTEAMQNAWNRFAALCNDPALVGKVLEWAKPAVSMSQWRDVYAELKTTPLGRAALGEQKRGTISRNALKAVRARYEAVHGDWTQVEGWVRVYEEEFRRGAERYNATHEVKVEGGPAGLPKELPHDVRTLFDLIESQIAGVFSGTQDPYSRALGYASADAPYGRRGRSNNLVMVESPQTAAQTFIHENDHLQRDFVSYQSIVSSEDPAGALAHNLLGEVLAPFAEMAAYDPTKLRNTIATRSALWDFLATKWSQYARAFPDDYFGVKPQPAPPRTGLGGFMDRMLGRKPAMVLPDFVSHGIEQATDLLWSNIANGPMPTPYENLLDVLLHPSEHGLLGGGANKIVRIDKYSPQVARNLTGPVDTALQQLRETNPEEYDRIVRTRPAMMAFIQEVRVELAAGEGAKYYGRPEDQAGNYRAVELATDEALRRHAPTETRPIKVRFKPASQETSASTERGEADAKSTMLAGSETLSWPPNRLELGEVEGRLRSVWGKSADEVGAALGAGWTRGTYGSKRTGWKFTRGDEMIFHHLADGRHGGEYYGYSSARTGKSKLVDSAYKHEASDKGRIFFVDGSQQ